MLVKLEESWAEIHNKLGPKLKIPLMLEKIKKISIKMCLVGIEPTSLNKYMHSPTAGPTEQI